MSSPGLGSSAHRRIRQPRDLTRPQRLALGVVAGICIAAGLPPWGWWPLTLVGVGALFAATQVAARGERFVVGLCVGLPWLGFGMAWMWFLTPPGYIVATALFASLHGLAAVLTPTGRERILVGPIVHTLAEVVRWSFPFGGVPLATLPIALSASPFLMLARLGGTILLCWFVLQVGAAAAAATRATTTTRTATPTTDASAWRSSLVALSVCAMVVLVSAVSPAGSETGTPVNVAAVQGGGEQGTTALEVPSRQVFEAHIEATRSIASDDTPLDLVTWPENAIVGPEATGFAGSSLRDALAAESARLGVPLVVGLTEDDEFSNHPHERDAFVNAQTVVYPDGSLGDRYEKVRIVPFGEYVPLRGVLTSMGIDLSLIPEDALPGQDPAQLRVRLDRFGDDPSVGDKIDEVDEVVLGVMISWEVFFSWRGRAAADNGAEILLNPTNGSSYTWTILQTQQIASSKLRAAENGRWVIQDSPTGFSAFISPDGSVEERTDISEQAVIRYAVPRRTGTTIYHATGNAPWVAALIIGWLAATIMSRTRRRRGPATAAPPTTRSPDRR